MAPGASYAVIFARTPSPPLDRALRALSWGPVEAARAKAINAPVSF